MQPVCKISITYWTYTAFVLLLSLFNLQCRPFFERGPGKLIERERLSRCPNFNYYFVVKQSTLHPFLHHIDLFACMRLLFDVFRHFFLFLTEQTTEKITTFAFQVALPWPYHIYTTCKCSNQLQQQRNFSNSIFFIYLKCFRSHFFYFILRRFFHVQYCLELLNGDPLPMNFVFVVFFPSHTAMAYGWSTQKFV